MDKDVKEGYYKKWVDKGPKALYYTSYTASTSRGLTQYL